LANEEREKGTISLSDIRFFISCKHLWGFLPKLHFDGTTSFIDCVNEWKPWHAGNDYFKQQKYPEAIKHYTESLKRNPKDPKVSNNLWIQVIILMIMLMCVLMCPNTRFLSGL
jgi:tetratricopeptide (TPR) repeat protein